MHLLVFTIAIIFSFLSCSDISKSQSLFKAEKGVLDIRNWNPFSHDAPSKEGIIKIDGEWEFYWKELLTSNDFICETTKPSCKDGKLLLNTIDYIKVPHSWNGHFRNGEILDGDGYATYRLSIQLPEQLVGEALALRSDYQGTAYRIFMNSKLTHSVGVVGKEESESEALHLPSVGFVQSNTNNLEIIVQVSNFHNRLGGLWNHLYLGRANEIQAYVNKRRGSDLFVTGIIFIIGIYHLLIWSIRRKEVSPLYFSLLCILVLTRLISTSEYLFTEAFPNLGYKFYSLLEYVSMYLSIPVAIQYFTLHIINKWNKNFIKFMYASSAMFTLYSICYPVRIFSQGAEYFQIFIILAILYILYILIYSIVKRFEYSVISLFGFIVLALAIIQDILYSRELI